MSRRERQETKTLVQQRQAQQRTAPTGTASIPFPAQYPCDATPPRLRDHLRDIGNPITAPARDMGIPISVPAPLSPAYTPPAKSPAEVGQEIDRQLAHLPQHGEPLTPAQEAALDLLTELARDIALHAHHSHLDEFIRRIPDLGTACGQAVANALRKAR